MNKQNKFKSVKLKICGVTNIETLNFLIDKKVEFFGLIFYKKSPRSINLIDALNLVKLIDGTQTNAVGVFVDCPLIEMQNYISKLKLKYIQLHGNENNKYIEKIKNDNSKVKIIKSIGLNNKNDLNMINEIKSADYFLFDYKSKIITDLPGGNSKKMDWKLLKNLNISTKWFLAGGINESNITEAINSLNPYGIDISSGVEEKLGVKSLHKISKIVNLTKFKNEY